MHTLIEAYLDEWIARSNLRYTCAKQRYSSAQASLNQTGHGSDENQFNREKGGVRVLSSKALPWSTGKIHEPFIQTLTIVAQPATRDEFVGFLKDRFVVVHEQAAHLDDGLSRRHFCAKCQFCCMCGQRSVGNKLTPPGINLPEIVAPPAGTTLGRGDATPGLIRIDSLITAVCEICY